MRKLFVVAIAIALLLSFTGLAVASVGYQKDGDNEGNASKIDIRNGYTSFDGSTLTFYANGYADGVTTNVSTESNLTSAALAYGVVKVESGTTRYVSLADGNPGQMITFILATVDGGSFVITDDYVASADTKTGWDDISFDAVNESVTLLYVDDTCGWIIVGINGATVT